MTQRSSNTFSVTVAAPSRYTTQALNSCEIIYTGPSYNDYPDAGRTTPGTRAFGYSSFVVSPQHGKIFFTGGGHGDGLTDSVWVLDVENPTTWDEAYDSWMTPALATWSDPADVDRVKANINHYTQPGGWLTPQRPYARHTYASMEWVSHRGSLLLGGKVAFGEPSDWQTVLLSESADRWLWNPDTQAEGNWTYLGSARLQSEWLTSPTVTTSVCYSEARQRVFYVAATAYTSVVPASANTSAGETRAYTPTIYRVWEYNIEENTFIDHYATASVPANAMIPTMNGMCSVAFNQAADEIGILTRGPSTGVWTFHTYSVAQKRRTDITLDPTGEPPMVSNTDIARLFHSNKTNRYLVLHGGTGALYALTIAGSTGTWSTAVAANAAYVTYGTTSWAATWDGVRGVLFSAARTAINQLRILAWKA